MHSLAAEEGELSNTDFTEHALLMVQAERGVLGGKEGTNEGS